MEKIIKDLAELGTRQGGQAEKAYEYLCSLLKKRLIPYATEEYSVDLPMWEKCSLKADGKEIPCLPTGLTSGRVGNGSALVSSLVSSRHFFDIPHINFNPKTQAISRANFSRAPSLAISWESLARVCKAKKIEGHLVVKRKSLKTYQILVGNRENPRNIVFSHFDSIGKGAIDNGSGTAVMINAILSTSPSLKTSLFVFDGNEELSYDEPIYWGKGYRNFEKKYFRQMSRAESLMVVDCVGYDRTQILSGKAGAAIIKLAFPIKNIDKFASKIKLITSDYDKLMSVYHSDRDNGDAIQDRLLQEAFQLLKDIL